MLSSVSPRANSISGHRANRPQALLQCLPPSAKRSERRGQNSKVGRISKVGPKVAKEATAGPPTRLPAGKRFTRLARAKNGTKNRVILGDLAQPWPSTQGCLGSHKSTSTSHFSLVSVAKSECRACQSVQCSSRQCHKLGNDKKSEQKDTQAIQSVSPISDQQIILYCKHVALLWYLRPLWTQAIWVDQQATRWGMG